MVSGTLLCQDGDEGGFSILYLVLVEALGFFAWPDWGLIEGIICVGDGAEARD